MKKIFIYLSMAASLLVVSCNHMEIDPQEPGTGNGTGTAISLGVKSADIVLTKAKAAGDSVYAANENKVYTLDYFIYRVNPSTNTSAEAITKGRLEFEGIEPTTDELAKANEQVIDLKDYYNDATEDKTCYVYVIANLTDDFTWTEGELYSGETQIGTTWTDLQALELASDFKKTLSSGKFKPQDSFVMTGLNSVTLKGKGPDEIIVNLARVASKISLDANVIKLIDKYTYNSVTNQYDYVASYFPNVDAIQIYLNYVDSTGTIAGTKEKYNNTFFTYNRYGYDATIKETTFKTKVLKRDDDGQIVTDESGIPTYTESDPFPAFNVTGSPFYSYPMEWVSSDTHAPFIKIIIPWVKYSVPDAVRSEYTTISSNTVEYDPANETYLALIDAAENFPTSASVGSSTITRLTTEAAMTSRKGDEYYYKINIPTSDYALESNSWYNIKLDISVLGSATDDAAVIISGSSMGIYVMDWSTPDDELGGDIDGGRYLSVAQDTVVINAVNNVTIPVISSHKLAAKITKVERKEEGDWVEVGRGSVTASGSSSVTLTNTLETTMGSSLDCYPFRFTIEVSQVNSDNTTTGSLYKTVVVYQYPSIYVDQFDGDNAFVNGYYGHVFVNGGTTAYRRGFSYQNHTGNSIGTSGNGSLYVSYGGMTRSDNTLTSMTVVNISALSTNSSTYKINNSETFKYLITDPRTGTINSSVLEDYNTNYNANGDSNTADWPTATIKVGTTSETAPGRNFIAPRIMISSTWGRNPTGYISFTNAQRRCATYQEAGYPAGRWRLPTEAEVNFIAELQSNGFLPKLFKAENTNSPWYWISNGTRIQIQAGNVNIGTGDEASLRCVYDLWYWGDKPFSNEPWKYVIAPGDTQLN